MSQKCDVKALLPLIQYVQIMVYARAVLATSLDPTNIYICVTDKDLLDFKNN